MTLKQQKKQEPIQNMPLEKAIETYLNSDFIHLNEIEKYYQSLEQLNEVIDKASNGLNPPKNGIQKINNHQWRVGRIKCNEGAKELLKYEHEIKKAKCFDDIFKYTENVRLKIKGLGHLWSYDTALRIAFNKGEACYPQKVYIQSGVKKGVKKLFNGQPTRGRSIAVSDIVSQANILNKIPAYKLENFFCIWGKDKDKSYNYC